MKSSFSKVRENILTRKFGGIKGSAEPYVTGYHFVWFAELPALLPDYTRNANSNLQSLDEIKNVLAATCLSVTPPGGTLGKVEFTGLGGIKWAVPSNIDYANTVSIKFLEMSKTPILDIMHGWVKLIRDYRTGITALEAGDQGEGYVKKTYAGLVYYWTTSPDAKSIEYYAAYDGIFPSKDPQDLFTSDVETVGRLDIEIEFNVDYAWHEPWVFSKCQELLGSIGTLASQTNVENNHF